MVMFEEMCLLNPNLFLRTGARHLMENLCGCPGTHGTAAAPEIPVSTDVPRDLWLYCFAVIRSVRWLVVNFKADWQNSKLWLLLVPMACCQVDVAPTC